jgi:hypothetical protein
VRHLTLFTVQLELGPETRALIDKVATNGTMHFELGPKTREMLRSVFAKDDSDGDEGLLRKGAKALGSK